MLQVCTCVHAYGHAPINDAVMLTCQYVCPICMPHMYAPCVCPCSLHHSLSKVYCPMLKLEQPGSSSAAAVQQQGKQLDPQLGDMLLDVQAGLAKAVRGAAGPEDRLQVITELPTCRHQFINCSSAASQVDA
jgi:hypothetical protein